MKKKIIKKENKKIRRDTFQNEDFIKIRPLQGGITYQPKVDIRAVDVMQFYENPDVQDLNKTVWRVNYSLINGDVITDITPYKRIEQAEKVSDAIVRSLPRPKPITTITQQVGPMVDEAGGEDVVGKNENISFGFGAPIDNGDGEE